TKVTVKEAEVVNSKGEVVKKIPLNDYGYGRFDLTAGTEPLKIAVTVNGTKHEQPLPAAQLKGIALEANSYALAGKTIIKLRTNKLTADSFAGKPLYLVAHRDEKASIITFSFDSGNGEKVIALPNTDLFEGLTTI